MSKTTAETPKPPLRLEWIEAGSLTENPANWRKHSQEQLATIRDLLDDPEIGWAGACLFNERTGRLIDGHARKTVVDPTTPVPVLVGNWSDEAEKKILATLDPVASMAAGDRDAYAALTESVAADSLWVRDLIHATLSGASQSEDEQDDATEGGALHGMIPEMECQPWEHHNFVVLMFRNDQDWQQACERLGIGKVKITYPGGLVKVGTGRVIDGPKALARLTGEPYAHNSHNAQNAVPSTSESAPADNTDTDKTPAGAIENEGFVIPEGQERGSVSATSDTRLEEVGNPPSAASAPSGPALAGSKTPVSADDARPTASSAADRPASAQSAPRKRGTEAKRVRR